MNIYLAIGLIVVVGIICFLVGLAIGSSGKASETERLENAMSLIADLEEKLDFTKEPEKENKKK